MSQLDQELVVQAAVRIIRTDGLGRLNMRRLAADLGVTAPALYRHVPGKRALTDAVVAVILRPLSAQWERQYAQIDSVEAWIDATRTVAYAARALYLDHPGLAGLLLTDGPPDSVGAAVRAEVSTLVELGLTRPRAEATFRAMARWVLAFAHGETLTSTRSDHDRRGAQLSRVMAGIAPADIHKEMTQPDEFSLGLEWMLDGIRREIHAAPRPDPPSSAP